MCAFKIKERFKTNERTQRVPFCQEIRNFIAESHKHQTLYANCEGSYPKRVINCQDKKLLQDFIFNSLYYNENSEGQSQSDSRRSVAVSICDEMISLSKRHNPDDEIHFSIVWVFYFEYELKVEKAMAVFKIFKKKSGSEAVFLDSHLKSYESWDCYLGLYEPSILLENAEFQDSFLCVPRHGEYTFDHETNMLVLEYVRSMKPKTPDNKCLFDASPFCLRAIRPLLNGVMAFVKTAPGGILSLRMSSSYLSVKLKIAFSNAVLFVIFLWKKIKESPFDTLESISSAVPILLNVFKAYKYSNAVMLANCINRSPWEILNNLANISQDGYEFFELLQSNEKDWLKILKLFCSLFKKSFPVLFLVLRIAPCSTPCLIIQILFTLLHVTENSVDCFKLPKNKNNTPNVIIKPENKNDEHNSSCSSSALQPIQNSFNQNSVVGFRQNVGMSFEEVLSNLPSLELVSANSMTESLEKVHSDPTGSLFLKSRIFIGQENGYGIYLFPELSLPRLSWWISELFKTDFSIKSKGINAFEITSPFGQTLGFVFFPSEFSGVGYFPVEIIGE